MQPIIMLLGRTLLMIIMALHKKTIAKLKNPECPSADQPGILESTYFRVSLTTPGYQSGKYPADMDCYFGIFATSPHYRIQLTVHSSALEEPIFGDCEDYVAVRESNITALPATDVVWCGNQNPLSITSSADYLFVQMKSDAIYQAGGVNMSFVEFAIPGCPQGWLTGWTDFCYKLVVPKAPLYKVTWTEAQRHCMHDKSNLLTITGQSEYAVVSNLFAQSGEQPWLGVYDTTEGKFESINPTDPINPSMRVAGNTADKDCVYLDLNKDSVNIYAADKCWEERSFICKRNTRGTTSVYPPPDEIVRQTAVESAGFTPVMTILLVVMAVVILIIIFAAVFRRQWLKKRNAGRDDTGALISAERHVNPHPSEIPTVIQPPPGRSASAVLSNRAKIAAAPLNNSHADLNGSQRPQSRTSASREFLQQSSPVSNQLLVHNLGASGNSATGDKPTVNQTIRATKDVYQATIGMPPVEKFDRPYIRVLDNVSTISLDEFWGKLGEKDKSDAPVVQ